MEQIVTIIHVCTAIALIAFILLQQGKGAEAGASFGAGASQTVFGSQGSGSLMTRITAILATTFFITSLILGYVAIHQSKPKSIDELLDKVQQKQSSTTSPSSSPSSSSDSKTRPDSATKNALPTTKEDNDIPKLPTQLPSNLEIPSEIPSANEIPRASEIPSVLPSNSQSSSVSE